MPGVYPGLNEIVCGENEEENLMCHYYEASPAYPSLSAETSALVFRNQSGYCNAKIALIMLMKASVGSENCERGVKSVNHGIVSININTGKMTERPSSHRRACINNVKIIKKSARM